MLVQRICVAALAFSPLTAVSQVQAKRPIEPRDLGQVAAVGDPQVSSDGRWVAYTVTTPDLDADKLVSHLWIASWDGKTAVPLTAGTGESETIPRFSPEGRRLAFAADPGGENDTKLQLMDRQSGAVATLPGVQGTILDIAWSPDARRLALIVQDPDLKAHDATLAGPTGPTPSASPPSDETRDEAGGKVSSTSENVNRPRPIVITRYHFAEDGEGYLLNGRKRLWIYDLGTDKATRLTTGEYDEALPAWSPDGKSIVFTSKRLVDPDKSYDDNLYVARVDETGTEPRRLTDYVGSDNAPDWHSYPTWSPDGRWIAYLQGGPPKLISYATRSLAVIAATGGEPKVLTARLDRNVTNPVWSPDGQSLRFTVEDDGVQRIGEVSAAGGSVRNVLDGFRVFTSLTAGPQGKLVMLVSSPNAPAEVYALDRSGLRRLSHQNDAWLKDVSVATVSKTVFHARDGAEVHGFQITPRSGRGPWPTVLFNHGGPQSQSAAQFNMFWQIFAGHGYAVVSSNFRGSTGRGTSWARALYADWGGPAVLDTLAAVDDAVARGAADPARLLVGGWSYGGILTDYILASDTRFRAAVSGASIANVFAGFGTDEYILDYVTELGTPWSNPDVWARNSYAFFHADRIVTPTLFMGDEKDRDVPALNSEQMYQALKVLNVDTGLIIYPGETHSLKRPSFQVDRMVRWLAWYDDHLGNR
jgi:dipeptidyl aminopeptidase/acylaminoacyl peptidase